MAQDSLVKSEADRINRHVERSHQGENASSRSLQMPKIENDPNANALKTTGRKPWQRQKVLTSNLLSPEEIPAYSGRIEWDMEGPDKARPAEWIVWSLIAQDTQGNRIDPPGADKVQVALHAQLAFDDPVRGLMVLDGRVERTEKGRYDFHFYTLTVGLYHLKLFYGPNALFKSADPTTEVVKGDQLVDSPESLNFELRGIHLTGIHVGKVAVVDLFVTNIAREPTNPNENLLSVRVFGNGRWQTMKLQHKDTGHYQIFMEERVAGIYAIKVKYEGVSMCSQKTVFYEPTSAENSVLIGAPSGKVNVGQSYQFKIQAKDILGQLAGPMNDTWTFGVFGPVEEPIDGIHITDNNDGTHTCVFTLPKAGNYTVRCTLGTKEGEKNSKGSPFKLTAV
jgi:hypothetical protein